MFNRIVAVFTTIAVAAACFAFIYIKGANEEKSPAFSSESKELNADDALIERLKVGQSALMAIEKKKELITSEIALSQVITWDDSWGDIRLFHKSQRIKFYGTGIYVCDLNELTKEHIDVDYRNKVIKLTIPLPKIKSITIDEEKTEYEDVRQGWFRFGDIRLSPVTYETLHKTVKDEMEKQMRQPDVYNKAKENSKASVMEILNEVFKEVFDEFSVVVLLA